MNAQFGSCHRFHMWHFWLYFFFPQLKVKCYKDAEQRWAKTAWSYWPNDSSSLMFCELGLGVLLLCCKWVDKVTRAVDQTAEQVLGDRVLPAWLDIIFLYLASSHTCNRVVVHMNAHSSTGIEPCFRSHCPVINNRNQQVSWVYFHHSLHQRCLLWTKRAAKTNCWNLI